MNETAEQRVAAAPVPPVPVARVDFGRRLVCILGLPFDVMGVDAAVERIRHDAFAGRRCFVSTPNLNFAISARADADFRGSVLRSDLSLVDGMPLVWLARLLGLPVRERVSGADVFEALQAHAAPPVSVFLFGGPPGAAEQACDAINRRGGGVRCAGFDAAGFGSIESMSSDAQIERINASRAQFVVASLGAKKGQAWLEHNAHRLTAPVLSHLGAVVNFAAGQVLRAPRWMRLAGLEWLWRIKEEPALWRRYGGDGVSALRLLFTRVLPDAVVSRAPTPIDSPRTQGLEVVSGAGFTQLNLQGTWCGSIDALRAALTQCAGSRDRVVVDLTRVAKVCGSFVAVLLVAQGWFAQRGGFEVKGASKTVCATFRRKLAGQLLTADAAR